MTTKWNGKFCVVFLINMNFSCLLVRSELGRKSMYFGGLISVNGSTYYLVRLWCLKFAPTVRKSSIGTKFWGDLTVSSCN
jgi:hypothetical protein